MAKTATQLVEAAKQRIENLSVAEVAEELERDDVLIVDIREKEELVDQGVIPGSVNVPRGVLEFWADPSNKAADDDMDYGRRIILHCAGGGRSALAADTLQEMGFERTAHLEGGFKAWKEAGQPVEPATAFWQPG